MVKKCKNCGKDFEARDYRQWCCSKECRKEYLKEKYREKHPKKIVNKKCAECGEDFETDNKRAKCCSHKCAKKNWEKNNREAIRKTAAEWNINNYDRKRKKQIEWEKNNIEHRRNKYLLREYGITLQCYNRIYKEQNGNCCICGISESELDKKLFIDHDHESGEVRGLLCHKCNTALGGFKDNLDLLLSAISYLKQENNYTD